MNDDDAGKGWVRIAREAERKLWGVARSERAEATEAIAKKFGVSANTVRRSVAALDFVRAEAPRYGVNIDAVGAPVSTIEVLMRIARVSPEDMGVYARRALLGNETYAGLRAHCMTLEQIAREEAKDVEPRFLNMEILASKIRKDLAMVGDFQVVAERSHFARAIRADLELEKAARVSDSENVIAIAAPGVVRAVGRGSADDTCVSLMAGAVAFSLVYYVVREEAQWSAVERPLRNTSVDFGRLKKLRVRS